MDSRVWSGLHAREQRRSSADADIARYASLCPGPWMQPVKIPHFSIGLPRDRNTTIRVRPILSMPISTFCCTIAYCLTLHYAITSHQRYTDRQTDVMLVAYKCDMRYSMCVALKTTQAYLGYANSVLHLG